MAAFHFQYVLVSHPYTAEVILHCIFRSRSYCRTASICMRFRVFSLTVCTVCTVYLTHSTPPPHTHTPTHTHTHTHTHTFTQAHIHPPTQAAGSGSGSSQAPPAATTGTTTTTSTAPPPQQSTAVPGPSPFGMFGAPQGDLQQQMAQVQQV